VLRVIEYLDGYIDTRNPGLVARRLDTRKQLRLRAAAALLLV
jgi:hypothetical protein